MILASWRSWAMLAVLALTGCEGLLGRHRLPNDPLFLSQRPVEGKTTPAEPMAVALIGPPPLPADLSERPLYARQRPATTPDHVTLSIPRAPETDVAPAWPREAPGILTNRPIRREQDAPPSRAP